MYLIWFEGLGDNSNTDIVILLCIDFIVIFKTLQGILYWKYEHAFYYSNVHKLYNNVS